MSDSHANQSKAIPPTIQIDPTPVPGETVLIWTSESERTPTRIKSVHLNAHNVVCFVHRRVEKPNDEIGHVDEKRGILVNGKPTSVRRG